MDAHELIAAMRAFLDTLDGQIAQAVKKEAFSKEGLRQTLNVTFPERPQFAPGKAAPLAKGAVPPALDDPKFQWRAGYVNAALTGKQDAAAWRPSKPYPGFACLLSNKEAQVYPNQDAIDLTGVDPISSDGESLIFTASKSTPEFKAFLPSSLAGTEYISGAMVSYPYSQLYGVFQMEAQIPAGRGLWPAFWLLPADGSWPPELDVFEVLGHDVMTAITTTHYRDAAGKHQGFGQANSVANLSAGFHIYEVRWSADKIEWAIDGEIVFTVTAPEAMIHKHCYLLADLAVGGAGSWPGAPNETTVFPAQMKIRSIRAWSF